MDQAQIRESPPATDRHPNHWATPQYTYFPEKPWWTGHTGHMLNVGVLYTPDFEWTWAQIDCMLICVGACDFLYCHFILFFISYFFVIRVLRVRISYQINKYCCYDDDMVQHVHVVNNAVCLRSDVRHHGSSSSKSKRLQAIVTN